MGTLPPALPSPHFLTKILGKIHKLLKVYEATKIIFIEISNLKLQGNYQMREFCNELCFLSESRADTRQVPPPELNKQNNSSSSSSSSRYYIVIEGDEIKLIDGIRCQLSIYNIYSQSNTPTHSSC